MNEELEIPGPGNKFALGGISGVIWEIRRTQESYSPKIILFTTNY